MHSFMKRFVLSALVIALVFGVSALMTSTDTVAKGKPNKPPKCENCPPTITLPDGTVCTLDFCGSDCGYTCPMPF